MGDDNDDEPPLRAETTATARHRADVADLTDLSHPELVTHIGRRSYAALAEVYDLHGGPAHSRAAQLCETDDIVQDVFLRLWRRPDRFEVARGSPRSFLMMQIRSRAIDLLRSSGSRRARETATCVEPIDPAAEDGALARLPANGPGFCCHASTTVNEAPSHSPTSVATRTERSRSCSR